MDQAWLQRLSLGLPFFGMNRKAKVWVKILIDVAFLDLQFTNITRDRVCLDNAFVIGVVLYIKDVFNSSIKKAFVHKVRKYAFRVLITKLCRYESAPEEPLDYLP